MLTIFGNGSMSDCEGIGRREFLRIGSLGLAGLSLPALLEARAQAAEAGNYLKDKAVVFLYLRGGPTQFELWDPKMTAPENIRSMTGEVKTTLPGVTIGGTFPKIAALADRMAFIRSFRVGTGNHGTGRQLVTSGGNPLKAAMGAIYGRLTGSVHPTKGMPSLAVVTPRAAGGQYSKLRNDVSELMATGELSAEFRPFDPGKGNAGTTSSKKRGRPVQKSGLIADMQLHLPEDRFSDRRNLLKKLDDLKRDLDLSGSADGLDRIRQQALDVLLGGVSDAFDLAKEDPRVVERYDTTRFEVPAKVLKKPTKNAKKIPEFSPVALGKQMLLARRLCEAGCGFVTVTSSGWDMHGNAFGINDGMPTLGPAVDHVVSTFLEDLHERGLADKILLVITGEMGRTPKINGKKGRDHWANICSLALAGGGLKMGQVVGASDRNGGSPATNPYRPQDLLATVMHTLFDVGQLRVAQGLPTDIVRLVSNGEPIQELF